MRLLGRTRIRDDNMIAGSEIEKLKKQNRRLKEDNTELRRVIKILSEEFAKEEKKVAEIRRIVDPYRIWVKE